MSALSLTKGHGYKPRVTFGPFRVSLLEMRLASQIASLHDKPANASTRPLACSGSAGTTGLEIRGMQGRGITVSIMNMLGTVVKQLTPSVVPTGDSKLPLDLSSEPSGSYLIVVSGDDGSRQTVTYTLEK